MIIEFDFTKDDYREYSLYHQFHSPANLRAYQKARFYPAFAWIIICFCLWYLIPREQCQSLNANITLMILFSAAPLRIIIFPWLYRRRFRKSIDRMLSEGQNRGLFTRRQTSLSNEGIKVTTEFNQTMIAWRGVERIVHNDDYAFIYISSMSAIVVPRRAFSSSSEFDQFIKTAIDYRNSAV